MIRGRALLDTASGRSLPNERHACWSFASTRPVLAGSMRLKSALSSKSCDLIGAGPIVGL